MPYVWRCSCGWESPEVEPDRWLSYWGKAMRHQYTLHGSKKDQEGGDGNYIDGLFDTETGEQITKGLNNQPLTRFFGNDGRTPDAADNHKAPPRRAQNEPAIIEESSPPPSKTAKAKKESSTAAGKTPTNIQGVVQGWRIPIPAPAMAYFSLARKHIQDDDGKPYEFDPAGFAKYVQDVFMHWHEEHIAVVLFGSEGIQLLRDAKAVSTMDKVIHEISGMTPNRDEIKDLVTRMLNVEDDMEAVS